MQKSLVVDENMNPDVHQLGFHSAGDLMPLNIFIKMISKQLTRVILKRLQHFVLKSLQKILLFSKRETQTKPQREKAMEFMSTP